MKRALTFFFFILAVAANADEGMWIPSVIRHTRLNEMRAKGLNLTAEDLYSVNRASLKDAIVRVGGCTAEFISGKGLILTNHHCGYNEVQYHSSTEHNYLADGFVAMNLKQELPSNDFQADILVKMEDVTDAVMKGVKEGMKPSERAALIKKNSDEIVKKAVAGNGYRASVEPLYYNNQYFLYVFERFPDVRLVVAPPESVGKFGGDTDNWMWPRHTGDFTIFRVYAGKDNRPAAYSPDNVPYVPKRSLTISTKPISDGDFTFIYGFPGRTSEYLHSAAVGQLANVNNVHKIALRTIRLDIMGSYMAADPEVRIQYAAKQAGVANSWKRWQGERRGVERNDAVGRKQEMEARFVLWAADKPEYRDVVGELQGLYDCLEPYTLARDYFYEAVLGVEAFTLAYRFGDIDTKNVASKRNFYKNNGEQIFKDYYKPIDVDIAKQMMEEYYRNVPSEYIPASLANNNWRISEWIDGLFATSLFTSKYKMDVLVSEPDLTMLDEIYSDPLFIVYKEFADIFYKKINPEYMAITADITSKYNAFMRGQMEMEPGRIFYPDANSTLRIAYGNVMGFEPSDGVVYTFQTTLDGVMAKESPDIYDYRVSPRLKELYEAKDYGRWGEEGRMPVCFLASNHTTGGNSGSPVLNGDGELIGLNFDRCWESTMSDIIYDITQCRNISVDIRYVLFITEKVCGAGYLLDEMKIN